MSVPIAPAPRLPLSPPGERPSPEERANRLTAEAARPAYARGGGFDRSKADPQNVKAGEMMEGMFVDYMMKVMRQTVPKEEGGLHSMAEDVYQGMLDNEYSAKAVRTGGIGLADQVIAYLESRRYTPNRGQIGPQISPVTSQGLARPNDPTSGTTARPTGGTHEGQHDDE